MGAKMLKDMKSKNKEQEKGCARSTWCGMHCDATEASDGMMSTGLMNDTHSSSVDIARQKVDSLVIDDAFLPDSDPDPTNEFLIESMSHGLGDFNSSQLSAAASAPSSTKNYPVVFQWNNEGKNVRVSGSYDDWKSKTALVRSDSGCYNIVDVPIGTHEFKFIVDGTWQVDKNLTVKESGCGTMNNVITSRARDYNVFKALRSDEFIDGVQEAGWSQHMPSFSSGRGLLQRGPPALPPYIADSILNEALSVHVDPSFLPEPNRTALNHLYTLSIKEGVAVLSATMRYRKKYITMVLYQPL